MCCYHLHVAFIYGYVYVKEMGCVSVKDIYLGVVWKCILLHRNYRPVCIFYKQMPISVLYR